MWDNFLQRNVRNVWDSSQTVGDLPLKSVDRLRPLLLRLLRTMDGNADNTLRSGGRKPPHPFKVITGLLNRPISIALNVINVEHTSAAWRNPATTPMRGRTIGTGIIEEPVLIISNIGRATPKTSLISFEKQLESSFCSILGMSGWLIYG